MKQLTGLDAGFLYMETASSFGHVSGLGVYRRPDDPDYQPYEAFKAQIESRLHLLDPFRRRLVEVPLGLDHPYWINDPDFDLDFHVRHIAIPAPGGLDQLSAQVARIIGRPMDRTKPLWEVYVMEGLENDDFAILSKIHHATVDGASGVELLTILLDTDPSGDEVAPDDGSWTADAVPGDMELLSRTVSGFIRRPYRLARVQLNTLQQMAEITRNKGLETVVSGVRRQLPAPWNGAADDSETADVIRPGATAPRTPFNKSITPHRRLAVRSVSLADVKELKTKADATVNDIVMAVCTGALRSYLLHHDALPSEPLQAMVPVSIRTGQEDDRWTNRVSGLIAALPTNEEDPVERIKLMRAAMSAAKEQFEMVPADAIVDLANFSSPTLATQAARLATSMRVADQAAPPVNVVISNVPGPRQPLYVAGAQLQHYYPVSTIAEGMGLNITVHSYMDTLDIGLVACRELVPDLEYLVDLHVEELNVLAAALEPSTSRKKAQPTSKAKPRKRTRAKSSRQTKATAGK